MTFSSGPIRIREELFLIRNPGIEKNMFIFSFTGGVVVAGGAAFVEGIEEVDINLI